MARARHYFLHGCPVANADVKRIKGEARKPFGPTKLTRALYTYPPPIPSLLRDAMKIQAILAVLSFCLYTVAAPTNTVVINDIKSSNLREDLERLSGTFKERNAELLSGALRRDAEPLSDTFKRDAEPLSDTFRRDAEQLSDALRRSSSEEYSSMQDEPSLLGLS
ncbi:hypothetical protein ACEPAF_5352 [Sanghuangporus sanghuang]